MCCVSNILGREIIMSLGKRMGLLSLAFFILVSISATATFWIINTQNKDALIMGYTEENIPT